jgi:hypothetical protein
MIAVFASSTYASDDAEHLLPLQRDGCTVYLKDPAARVDQRSACAEAGRLPGCHIDKPGVVPLEGDCDGGRGSLPVLRHDQVCFSRAEGFPVVGIFPEQKDDYVCGLRDRIGLAEISEQGFLVDAVFWIAVELGGHHDRHPEVQCERLQLASCLAYLALPGLAPQAGGDELEVIDGWSFTSWSRTKRVASSHSACAVSVPESLM